MAAKEKKVKTVKRCPYCKRKMKAVTVAPDYSFIVWQCEVHGRLLFDYSSRKWMRNRECYV
jgi:hypothetical protein